MGKWKVSAIVVALCAAFLGCGITHAAIISLTQTFPDVTGGVIKVTYDGAGNFVASGTTSGFSPDGTPPPFTIAAGGSPSRAFKINMTLDTSGNLVSGTVVMNGKIASIGANSGSLLTGNVTGFGFDPSGGQLFEILFDITGGDLATPYYGGTFKGGMILNAIPGSGAVAFTGDFSQSFTNTTGIVGTGTADAFIVPEPGTIALSSISMLALLRRRRRAARCN